MRPDEVTLWQTGWACPEQYDAYTGELDLYDPYPELSFTTLAPRNTPIGYLRLRHGLFTVDVYDGDETVLVYEFHLDDDAGLFASQDRQAHLLAAKQAIANYFTYVA